MHILYDSPCLIDVPLFPIAQVLNPIVDLWSLDPTFHLSQASWPISSFLLLTLLGSYAPVIQVFRIYILCKLNAVLSAAKMCCIYLLQLFQAYASLSDILLWSLLLRSYIYQFPCMLDLWVLDLVHIHPKHIRPTRLSNYGCFPVKANAMCSPGHPLGSKILFYFTMIGSSYCGRYYWTSNWNSS